MSQKAIKGTPELAKAIKNRRQELKLTVEEAAKRAGVGTKTWFRYEAGEAIRSDKAKGICKALNWSVIPDADIENEYRNEIKEYRKHKAWSEYLYKEFGEMAAASFAAGSDMLLDDINEDISELSKMPAGSHIGQLSYSSLQIYLPQQFLTRYDYEFLYCLKATVLDLINRAKGNNSFVAHSVMEELSLYLISKEAEAYIEIMAIDMDSNDLGETVYSSDWIYDIFEDMDIETFLFSDLFYLENDDTYHFDNWRKAQFYN